MMVIKSMPNIREAMDYFSQVVANRSLYESLQTRSYRNFLISDENLEKLISDSNIGEYVEFFRNYYISGAFARDKAEQPKPTVTPN